MLTTTKSALVLNVIGLVAIVASLASAASAASGATVTTSKARTAASAPGLLVSLEDGALPNSLPRGSVLISRTTNAYMVPFAPNRSVANQLRVLRALPEVLTAQVNRRLRAAAPPGTCSSHPQNPLVEAIYSLRIDQMELPPAAATIAVLDSGIVERNEFIGKLVSPFSFASGTSDFTDTDGHGTAVAGIAAAAEGGIRGVSPQSKIMPIKILDQAGETTSAILVQGIDYAVEHGAGVINISSAAPHSSTNASDDTTVIRAINEAFARGVTVVAAAGNDGDEEPNVPSAYPHVISVGALDGTGNKRASFSNFGESIDVMAPGDFVMAPVPGTVCPQGYVYARGTSFAAPALSGAAAILKEMRPELSATQILDQFREVARDVDEPGWDLETGFGIADLQLASSATAPARDGKEVDDDIYWVTGSRARKHPFQLTKRRRSKTIEARVGYYNDPTDVYRLQLKKRDKFSAVLTGLPGQTIVLELWNKKAKGFDIAERNVSKRRIAFRQGTGKKVKLARKIGASGTYYLSVSPVSQERQLNSYRLSLKRK